MKKSLLIELLENSEEEEVIFEIEDECFDNVEIEHIEESFDGFTAYYPPTLSLKLVKDNDTETDIWD